MKDINRYSQGVERLLQHVKAENKAGRLPTFRVLARRYRTTIDAIEQMVNDCNDLDYNIGIRVGSGIGIYQHRGMWNVEYTGREE